MPPIDEHTVPVLEAAARECAVIAENAEALVRQIKMLLGTLSEIEGGGLPDTHPLVLEDVHSYFARCAAVSSSAPALTTSSPPTPSTRAPKSRSAPRRPRRA